MAADIEKSYWIHTATEPSARLCNFATNKADLLPSHKSWLSANVLPLLRGGGTFVIEIGGLASRLGSPSRNEILSQARADAVKTFLESQLQTTLPNIQTDHYGERVSGGGPRDNDGFWRAVLFKYHQGATVLPPPPPEVVRPPAKVESLPKLYFGLGVKFGGIIVGGTQAMEGYLYSAEDFNDQAFFEAQIFTLGAGLGGGANIVLILAYGGTSKGQFVGTRFEGWDFAVSLGGRWGDALKSVKTIPTFAKLARLVKDGGNVAKILKGASKLTYGEWEKFAELIKASREAAGFDDKAATPQISAYDIPLAGAALEVSIYKWWGRVETFR